MPFEFETIYDDGDIVVSTCPESDCPIQIIQGDDRIELKADQADAIIAALKLGVKSICR